MGQLQVSLFGKFCVRCGEQLLEGLDALKVQELFCYLLLHSNRPHHRETLASLLWQEQSQAQSKSYLRRALWQLQNALPHHESVKELLHVDADWIRLDCTSDLWMDVAIFEHAFSQVKDKPGTLLSEADVHTLAEAVDVYHGDLLEGWYQDWCLFERERLQQMLLMMLDKLMEHCESCGAFEEGIVYGTQILRYDLARERTHRRLMRLYYLAGDRTGALRQYERCTAVLQEELGVKPAQATERLHMQIQADQLDSPTISANGVGKSDSQLQNALSRLLRLDAILGHTRQEIRQEIQQVKAALSGEGG